MKKITAFAFCLTLAFFLAACGKAPVSSTGGASLPPSSSGSAASSGALSTAGGASSAPASSSSSPSSESPSVDTSGWTRRFISLPVMHPDGGAGEKALVILSAPTDWEYDNYTTFTRDGIKVAEVLNLWPATSGASPFTDAMTEPYADNSFYPEGYGLLSTEDTELNGNALRILHMKTWPDDADKPWYPQYMFYELDGYVVELVSPNAPDSVVGGLIKTYKNAPYHLCYVCENLDEEISKLTGEGYVQIDLPTPAPAIGGKRVSFLMNRFIGMIELLEQ